MRSDQRKQHIMQVAQENGFVSIPKTAASLGVSVETVRRDINALCEKNQLKKVYGGAAPVKSPIWRNSKNVKKSTQNQQGKTNIAKEAAKMIRDDTVIILDGSEATLRMVDYIPNVHGVTFVVNSLKLATSLVDKINSGNISGTVIMAGGQIITTTYRSYTLSALDFIDRYHYDLAFISAPALSVTGASTTSTNPGMFVQRLMRRASSCVLMVESQMLGKHSVMDFAKIQDFDRIITDDANPCPADILDVIQQSNTTLTVVHCD
jgi:DeoR/GlpR family transcriptional regulator of sugar metabolism